MGSAVVTLTIVGECLDPDMVTTALGAAPTQSHRACDPSLRRSLGDRLWRSGLWALERKEVPIDDISQTIASLTSIFERGHQQLSKVGGLRYEISVGLFTLRENGEAFELEPSLLRSLAQLGMTLMVDAYGGP